MALTRRARLGGLVLMMAVAGCDSAQHHSPSPRPTARPSAPATTTSKSPPTGLPEAPTAGTIGVCRFAQVADVAKAFGARPGAVTVSAGVSGIGNTQCTFTLPRSNVGRPGTVRISLRSRAKRSDFAQARKAARKDVTVSGVGDAAFYVADQTTLQLIRRTSLIVIQVSLRTPAHRQTRPAVVKADAVSLGKLLARQL